MVGLPLGLGKANHIINALYRRAAADRALKLTFFSALTLEKPRPSNDLERRFIAPVIERLFGGYPDLDYAAALHAGRLPPNIEVAEFFFLAGRWLRVPFAQQHYISANYTHAAGYVRDRGLNVITQLVAKRVVNGETRYSLSCNTDTTLDLLKARAEGKASFRLVGQVNSELPFMPGPGDLPASAFSAVLDSPDTDFPLFAPPSEPVSDAKYAMGLHAASLIRDGGSRARMRDLDIYFEDCVVGGPGAFIVPVHDRAGFAEAIRRKLVLAIAGTPPRLMHAAETRPLARVDCLIGEKTRGNWFLTDP